MNMLMIAVVLMVTGAAGEAACPAKAKDPSLEGAALLMTRKVRSATKLVQDAEERNEQALSSYGPFRSSGALKYFMKWARGSVESKVRRELVSDLHVVTDSKLLQTEGSQHISMRAASLFAAAVREQCGESIRNQSWSLLEMTESGGVEHLVLRSEGTAKQKIQYLAVRHGRVLVADPPVTCLMQKRDLTSSADSDGADPDLLDPETDEAVKDCKKLFIRTAAANCNKTMEVRVIHATREVIDGFRVDMEVEVTGPSGKTTHHTPSCLFETSSDRTDASLLQQEADPADTDPTEEEKAGLVATLLMHTDLCKADELEGINCRHCSLWLWLGELSMYKGFEHVNDELGRIDVPLMEGVPSEVDHRNTFPKCFRLQNGKESVRNQGACASCWAFAAASAAMNNLCASKDGAMSLASEDDRYEVSVQQLMSCNRQERGCKMGSAGAAHTAWMKNGGISKERDYPYKCGGGNPKNHFEQESPACESFPWGAQCAANSAVPGWLYGGIVVVSGESSMMAVVADGYSLYTSMDVYGNFFKHKDGVYQTLSGDKEGGHALTAIGYGNEDGTKYWLLQNSWGPRWGIDGYGKVQRGTDLAGIEANAYWVKAWVAGGKQPPCRDGMVTGVSAGGKAVPCTDAIGGGYGNLCKHKWYAEMVKSNCPLTCDSCLAIGMP